MITKPSVDIDASVALFKQILADAKSECDEQTAKKHFIKSVNASDDVMFDKRGKVVLTKTGMSFVREFDQKYPARMVKDRFENAITKKGNPLQDWGLREQFNIVRTGFTERGLPINEAQTNGEHVLNMLRMSQDTLTRAKIVIHDVIEDLTTDMSKPFVQENDLADTKIRLEKMGAAILFQKEPILFQLWMEYEDKATARDHNVKEIDNLEHVQFVSGSLQSGIPSYLHESFIEAVRSTLREGRIKLPLYDQLARNMIVGTPSEILALPER